MLLSPIACPFLPPTYQGRAREVQQRVMAHVLRQELIVRGKELAFFRRQLPLQMRGDDGPAGFPTQFADLVEAMLIYKMRRWKGRKRGRGRREGKERRVRG